MGNGDSNAVIIQSGATNAIHFATITGLQPRSMTGQLHLKVNYGKRKDALHHSYELRGETQIAVNLLAALTAWVFSWLDNNIADEHWSLRGGLAQRSCCRSS
jgi:hypothetical protein